MKCTADMLKVPPVLLYRDGRLTKYEVERDDWADSFIDCTHHFIDAIKNDTDTSLDGARAREVLGFSLAMMRSANEGREVYLREFE